MLEEMVGMLEEMVGKDVSSNPATSVLYFKAGREWNGSSILTAISLFVITPARQLVSWLGYFRLVTPKWRGIGLHCGDRATRGNGRVARRTW
jgi:hypothetical protein